MTNARVHLQDIDNARLNYIFLLKGVGLLRYMCFNMN